MCEGFADAEPHCILSYFTQIVLVKKYLQAEKSPVLSVGVIFYKT